MSFKEAIVTAFACEGNIVALNMTENFNWSVSCALAAIFCPS